MSDLHKLPLVGHDLPEPARPVRAKIRVFKEAGRWTWEHRCTDGLFYGGGHHALWADCAASALRHLERCR